MELCWEMVDVNYTPSDLGGIIMKRALFDGYNKKQVNSILADIMEDYTSLNNNIHELKCQISVLNETLQHYKILEESLQHSILVAQHTGEQIKANACDKAKNIVDEAEVKARKMVDEASGEVQKIRANYEHLKSEVYTFKTRSEALLQAQMDVVKQLFAE